MHAAIGAPNLFYGNWKRANDMNEIYESVPAILRIILKMWVT